MAGLTSRLGLAKTRKKSLLSAARQAEAQAEMKTTQKQFSLNRGALKSKFLYHLPLKPTNKLLLTLAFLIFMTVGCKTGWISPAKMSKISVGMSKAEVTKILGTPHSAEGRQNRETLWYMEDQGHWIHKGHFVTLVGGKVESYGHGIPQKTLNLNVKD